MRNFKTKFKIKTKLYDIRLSKCLLIFLAVLSSFKSTNAVRCYLCLFHLAHCTNPLDCYNQPDICTNTNFSPVHAPVVDCEFGCEQYVVTDATGSNILWRRGCASEGSPKSSYVCFNRNINFLRHEQCWCHKDYCNSAPASTNVSKLLLVAQLLSVSLVFVISFHHRDK